MNNIINMIIYLINKKISDKKYLQITINLVYHKTN